MKFARPWLRARNIQELMPPELSDFLHTGGAEIRSRSNTNAPIFRIAAGSIVALIGPSQDQKHLFCDRIMGYSNLGDSRVELITQGRMIETATDRMAVCAVLGRSPLLYGETIQESLLYRTRNVRKEHLYTLLEKLYGPELAARTNPANPLLDRNNMPVPTHILTAREHIEIAQINVLLQRTPLVVIDLASPIMTQAICEGFHPSEELLSSGKTILAIVPPAKSEEWFASIMGKSADRVFEL